MDEPDLRSSVFEKLTPWIRRAVTTVAAVVLAASLPSVGEAQAAPAKPAPVAPKDRSVPVGAVPFAAPRPAAQSETERWAAPAVQWPRAGTADVTVGTAAAAVPGQPVRIGPATSQAGRAAPGTSPARVTSALLGREHTRAAGVSGLTVALHRADGEATATPVSVEIDYSGIEQAYGANYADRVRLVRLPACAARTPEKIDCQAATPLRATNDAASSRIVADVAVGGESTVLAVTAAAVGPDTGTFARSSLAASGSWVAGQSSGDFAWSYPVEVPPAPGDVEPEVELTYNSGAVDGRTNAENTQTSWAGEGWDYEPGYIERQYRSCRDDVAGATTAQYTNATDDLCYRDANATLSWNGKSTDLVLDDATGRYKLAEDDGSTLELITGGSGTGLHDNEHWRLITPDGTQFWFGRTRLPGWAAGQRVTNSVWGAPVFHNRTGEPCYKTGGFAGSWCSMAWRWNLDHVVDPSGNSMSYWYAKEANSTKLAGGTTVARYERGGWLERIEYGTRAGSELTGTPPLKVDFGVSDRCFASCRSGTTPVAANWPDTPWDLQCDAAPCTNSPAPSFWTAKRLTSIITPVDDYRLSHLFPATGESTVSPSLWLTEIRRVGLPAVTFSGTRYANRTDYSTANGVPAVNRYRVTRIVTEAGGEVGVAYEGSDCTTTSQANPDSNSKRCFPQYYQPPTGSAGWSWWNKYRVQSVTEKDLVGGSPSVVQAYDYGTAGASTSVLWHYNDDQKWSLPTTRRSWSDWRGYATVKVTTGGNSKVESRYFRGLHGDRTDAGETARTASLTDSHGTAWTDHNQLAGSLLEEIEYAADGTTVLAKKRLAPWSQQTGSRVEADAHVLPAASRSYLTGVQREETFEYLPDSGTWREHEVEFEHHPLYGQVTREIDRNAVSDATDDVCTTTTYARNFTTTVWLIDYPAEELITDCGSTVLGGERTYYDGSSTLGAAPTRGLDTRTDDLADATRWVTSGTATYDALGRVKTETDALGRVDRTDYVPETGGPVTSVIETDPALFTVKSTLDVRGNVLTETDENNRTTTAAYDPLGRLTKVWVNRDTSGVPDSEYIYGVQGSTAPSWIHTRTLGPNGNQIGSYDIYDGHLRPRQTQDTAPDGKRAVSDTRYDNRGLVSATTDFYNDGSAPTSNLVAFADTAVDAQDRYTYDGLERLTEEALWARNVKKWSTTAVHAGDRTTVTPPSGGTKTTAYTGITGQVVRLRQHRGPGAQDPVDETKYAYDRLGRLTSTTDAGNNTWTRAYDLRGRLTASGDPDSGSQRYEYDDADQLKLAVDAREWALWYQYDGLGRVVETRDGGPTGTVRTTMTYDTLAKGELTEAIRYHEGRPYTQTVTGYTDQYEPLGLTVNIPPEHGALHGNYTIGYSYKPDGSLATAIYPAVAGLGSERVDLTYTDQGDLATMKGLDTYLAGATYAWHGGVKQRLLGSGGKRLKLDEAYEDATFRHTKSQVSTERAGAANTFDEQLTEQYKHDPAGNITAINEIRESAGGATVSQQCFQHDYLRRLTEAWTTTAAACQSAPAQSAVGGPGAYWQSFTYDVLGNRTTDTVHAASGDTVRDYTVGDRPHTLKRREARGGGPATDYTYDVAGNLESRSRDNGTEWYLWNVEGLLDGVLTAEGNWHGNVYDAGGTRLLAGDASGTTLELGHTEIRMANSGQLSATRNYGDAVRTTAGLVWITADHHGTGQLAVDSASLTTVRRRTTPFGEARGTSPVWPDNKGFVGGAVDTLGFVHLGAREYDPSTGRFLTVDPLIDYFDPQMLNGYAYANNSPVTFTDPDGLIIAQPGGGGGGGAIGAVGGKSSVKSFFRSLFGRNKPKPRKAPVIPKSAYQHSSSGRAQLQAKQSRTSAKPRPRPKPKKTAPRKVKKSTAKRGSGGKKSTGKKATKAKKRSNGGKRTGKPTSRKSPKKTQKRPAVKTPAKGGGKKTTKPVTLPPSWSPRPQRDLSGVGKQMRFELSQNAKQNQDMVANVLDQMPDDDIGDLPGFVGSLADGAASQAESGTAVPRGPPGHAATRAGADGIDPADLTSLVGAIVWTILRARMRR